MTLGIVVGLILSEKVKIILTNFCEKGYWTLFKVVTIWNIIFIYFYFFTVLASSGIDYDIKIWAPLEEYTNFNEDVSNEVNLCYIIK
jgi:uncharacterized protein YacL